MREQVHSMDVAGYAEGHEFNLTGLGEPVRLTGTMVSADLFSVLGARPELGRTFYSGEDHIGQDNLVILSHALWEQRFGKDTTILGRSIELEGVSRRVVGVMPTGFRFPSTKTQVWLPLRNDPQPHVYWADDFMPLIGRLRHGATLQQAHAEIRMFQSHVGELFTWPMPKQWNADVSAVPLQNGMVADVRTRLLMLLGAVALVLLIACANVANLTLSRSATREKEIGIRTALGAGRLRIIRQLLTENVVLALFGVLLGLFFAAAGLSLLKAWLPSETPRLFEVHMDWQVLVFTAALAILTGFIFGLAPALQSSRAALTETLRSGGRGASLAVRQSLRCEDDANGGRFDSSLYYVFVCHLRRHCVGVGADRDLWGTGVSGVEAHAGNRYPHGAGDATLRRSLADFEGGREVFTRRNRAGIRRSLCRDTMAGKRALRSRSA